MKRTAGSILLLALLGANAGFAQERDRSARLRLAAEVRAALRSDLQAWYPRAVDREAGGFLSEFDFEWRPSGAQDKMIVTQARHVWTNARAAQFFAGDAMPGGDRESERARERATHGYRFLRDRMWDRENGGFFWLVTRDGTVKSPDASGLILKQAYGVAFGIYALAAYYDVARDTAALNLARTAFHWLDSHAHDPVHGGYFNYMERDGTPLRTGYGRDSAKDQNSSIHILEAFTELYRVWPDPVLRSRLQEMLRLIRDTIQHEPGTLTLFSSADWQPVSYRDSSDVARRADHYYHDAVSFGHDIETAYLMLEASEALGLRNDTLTLRVARKMADHTLRTGWDEVAGGIYDAGYYFRDSTHLVVVRETKNWWAQAEALNTLLLLSDRFPNDPMRYFQKFEQQWAYIDRYLIDHEHGGWYQGGLDKQPESRTDLKGHIWKAAYHDARALMNVARRLAKTTSQN